MNCIEHQGRRPRVAMALAAAALMAGCAAPPTRYYTLAEPVAAATATTARAADGAPTVIELAPLGVPERLARPQMVVRQPGGTQGPQIEVLEQHRWASSFESELRDALASGIAGRLGAVDATRGSRPAGQPAWRIAVQVRDFDAVETRGVDVSLSWTVRRSDQTRDATCQWSASEPVGPGIDALAQGAQRLTGRASEAIARHVAALRADADAGCPAGAAP